MAGGHTSETPLIRDSATEPVIDTVATVLEQESQATIGDWLRRLDKKHLTTVQANSAARSSHLPELFLELIHRLRNPIAVGAKVPPSQAAAEHCLLRRKQGPCYVNRRIAWPADQHLQYLEPERSPHRFQSASSGCDNYRRRSGRATFASYGRLFLRFGLDTGMAVASKQRKRSDREGGQAGLLLVCLEE